jgi:hypothetical protein
MKAVRKGLDNIRTMRSGANSSLPLTAHGAIMEHGRLWRERERLCSEKDRLERRIAVINNRLGEIEKVERSLEHVVEVRDRLPAGQAGGLRKGKGGAREMVLKY